MADFSWTQALPIGIVMFVGTWLGWLRRKAGRSLARRGYPDLATELGLEFEAPRYAKGMGKLRGEFEGYKVLVDPDEAARAVLWFQKECPVDLRSYGHWKRLPPGYEPFSTGDLALDRWLQSRLVRNHADVESLLSEDFKSALSEVRFAGPELKQFAVDAERIECRFDFGQPPYVPPALLRRLLPALGKLAAVIEESANAETKSQCEAPSLEG